MSNISSPVWKIEIETRIAKFALAIDVDLEKTTSVLRNLGIDSNSEKSLEILESEDCLPISDLFKAFCDTNLTQIAKVRLGYKSLRASIKSPISEISALSQSIEQLARTNRPKNTWTDEELLDVYEVEEMEILRQRTHGRHCIVYSSDNVIDREISLKLISIAKKQTTSATHIVNDRMVRVFRAGEIPVSLIDESPFCPNSPLVDGVCGQTGTNWNGVSFERRLIVRIHILEVEKVQLSKHSLFGIWNDAVNLSDNAFASKYQEAFLRRSELEKMDKLPKLKVSSHVVQSNKKDTGF